MTESFAQLIGLEQTLGKELAEDTYMGDLSRSLLKTNPEALYVEIHDEITHAFELNIPSDSEGKPSTCLTAITVWLRFIQTGCRFPHSKPPRGFYAPSTAGHSSVCPCADRKNGSIAPRSLGSTWSSAD